MHQDHGHPPPRHRHICAGQGVALQDFRQPFGAAESGELRSGTIPELRGQNYSRKLPPALLSGQPYLSSHARFNLIVLVKPEDGRPTTSREGSDATAD